MRIKISGEFFLEFLEEDSVIPEEPVVEEPTPVTAVSNVVFKGRSIYNAEGQQVILRGAEITVSSGLALEYLDHIASMGANAVRLLFDPCAPESSPALFRQALEKVRQHGMVAWVSWYVWHFDSNGDTITDACGSGEFWEQTAPEGHGTCSLTNRAPCFLAMWDRQWVKDLINEFQDCVIIDAQQEWAAPEGMSDADARLNWKESSIRNIAFFRNRGMTHPLAVMSNVEGRDLFTIVSHGQEVVDSDTVKVDGQGQVIFGWQAYWSSSGAPDWYPSFFGQLFNAPDGYLTATEAISTILPTLPFPVQCGFDAYAADTNGDFPAQIAAAADFGISWLWWDYRNGDIDMQGWPQYRNAVVDGFSGV